MNLHRFDLNDFPEHLAAGCFEVSLLSFHKQKIHV